MNVKLKWLYTDDGNANNCEKKRIHFYYWMFCLNHITKNIDEEFVCLSQTHGKKAFGVYPTLCTHTYGMTWIFMHPFFPI